MFKKMLVWSCVMGTMVLSAQNIIAEWDFSKGSPNSTDGKFVSKLRGKTHFSETQKSLVIGKSDSREPEGLMLGKNYPELSPTGAFRLDVTCRFCEKASGGAAMILWDSKYVHYSLNNPKWHYGMTFFLVRKKQDSNAAVMPQIALGFGDHSEIISGGTVEIDFKTPVTFSVEYDGADKCTFFANGKIVGAPRSLKTGGPLAPSRYGISIGDRLMALSARFDGEILSVKLTDLSRPAAEK